MMFAPPGTVSEREEFRPASTPLVGKPRLEGNPVGPMGSPDIERARESHAVGGRTIRSPIQNELPPSHSCITDEHSCVSANRIRRVGVEGPTVSQGRSTRNPGPAKHRNNKKDW